MMSRCKQTSRQADTQTSGQADKRTSRQADKQTSRQTDKQTSGQADKRTSRQADKQTSRQADTEYDVQTHDMQGKYCGHSNDIHPIQSHYKRNHKRYAATEGRATSL